MILGLPFRRIWCLDFEFVTRDGENPRPVCFVAKELGTGRLIRLWQDQLGPEPPFEIDDDTLIIAYYAPAEIGCFLELGWPAPTRIIDLRRIPERNQCARGCRRTWVTRRLE
jgi:DNA polymerase I